MKLTILRDFSLSKIGSTPSTRSETVVISSIGPFIHEKIQNYERQKGEQLKLKFIENEAEEELLVSRRELIRKHPLNGYRSDLRAKAR